MTTEEQVLVKSFSFKKLLTQLFEDKVFFQPDNLVVNLLHLVEMTFFVANHVSNNNTVILVRFGRIQQRRSFYKDFNIAYYHSSLFFSFPNGCHFLCLTFFNQTCRKFNVVFPVVDLNCLMKAILPSFRIITATDGLL